MPFNGSGVFNRDRGPSTWQSDATAGVKIKADLHDINDNDIANGLSLTLTKDGQSSPTADINWNGKKITNLAAPTLPTDAANKAYTDSLRSFSSSISLTGATPEARISFVGADLSFGTRVAGTPAGSLNRFVWNDNGTLTGTDVMQLTEAGVLAVDIIGSITGSTGGGLSLFASKAAAADGAHIGIRGNTGGGVPTEANGISFYTGGTGTEVFGLAGYFGSNKTLFVVGNVQANGGTINVQENGAIGNAHLKFTKADGSTAGFVYANIADSTMRIQNNMGGPVDFKLASDGTVSALRLISTNGHFVGSTGGAVLGPPQGSAGNVSLRPNGISTTTGETRVAPSGDLYVAGAVTANQITAVASVININSATNSHLFFNNSAGTERVLVYGEATGNLLFRLGMTASSAVMYANGNFTISGAVATKASGTSWVSASDVRIKNVTGDYQSGLAEIRQLTPRTFTYKGNDTPRLPGYDPVADVAKPREEVVVPYTDSPHHKAAVDGTEVAGLIAQEAELAMPDLVAQGSGWIDGVEVQDFRTIDVTNVTYALINAVKELADRIDALEGTPA